MTNKVIAKNAYPLEETIEEFIDFFNFKPQYPEIIIKPNLLCYLSSDSGHVTNVKVVRALIKVLIKKFNPKKIYIAESSYINADTERSFKTAGYYDLKKEFSNVDLIDLKKAEYEETPYKIKLPKLLKNKTLIDVPILKGHPQVGLTCALKNLKGLLTDTDKRNIHKWGLEENLVLLDNIKVDFVLVDAIYSRNTFGNIFNERKQYDYLIAGLNPVFVDLAAASLVGLRPEDLTYLNQLWKDKYNNKIFELIGINKKLDNWKNPKLQDMKIGRITLHITHACSRCWDAGLEAINPKHIQRTENTFKRIYEKMTAVLFSLMRKKKVSLVMGKNPELVGDLKNDKIILCGDCAIKHFKMDSSNVPGCPPDSKIIREKIKEIS